MHGHSLKLNIVCVPGTFAVCKRQPQQQPRPSRKIKMAPNTHSLRARHHRVHPAPPSRPSHPLRRCHLSWTRRSALCSLFIQQRCPPRAIPSQRMDSTPNSLHSRCPSPHLSAIRACRRCQAVCLRAHHLVPKTRSSTVRRRTNSVRTPCTTGRTSNTKPSRPSRRLLYPRCRTTTGLTGWKTSRPVIPSFSLSPFSSTSYTP